MLASDDFKKERTRTQRFFNLVSVVYPLLERHLWPEYRGVLEKIEMSAAYSVLDLATGTGMLAGAFAERGHVVTGLDFADRLLNRARRKFPLVNFRTYDLLNLGDIEAGSHDVVCMGYVLHGLSPEFRRYVVAQSSRIARRHVLVFDYCCEGSWFVRLIERIEGPNYPGFLAEDRHEEFANAGLYVDHQEQVSDFGGYWFCSTS
jgi:SAM-dependent methyltransferase